ncbi:MAG: hypothetical protein ACOYXY_00600 [Thermodesulfobacteriota bacterium]
MCYLGSSYDGFLPASDHIIQTRGSEATALFPAVIMASVEAIRKSGPELGLMNPPCIPVAYTRGAVSVGNIGGRSQRIAPLYSTQKTLEFHHDTPTPEPNAIL